MDFWITVAANILFVVVCGLVVFMAWIFYMEVIADG